MRLHLGGGCGAYQRFHEFALQAQIAEDQRRAAEAQAQAAMDWGVWGPWWW